jgi:hypothetical protein
MAIGRPQILVRIDTDGTIDGQTSSDKAAIAAKNIGIGPGIQAQAETNDVKVGAVVAKNTGKGPGVRAESDNYNAIQAETGSGVAAVAAINNGTGPGIWAQSAKSDAGMAAVHAINKGKGPGIRAEANTDDISVAAVVAKNTGIGPGIKAEAKTDNEGVGAVFAKNTGKGPGVRAVSDNHNAVQAVTGSGVAVAAVHAINNGTGPGILAEANTGNSYREAAVVAINNGDGPGIFADSAKWNGIHAQTGSDKAAVAAINNGTGPGIWAQSTNVAGHFQGNVEVTGDVIIPNADCAEDFEISAAEQVDAGTVMALNDSGRLEPVKKPYDKRVAGVISGAGDLKPALILGRLQGQKDRLPIALMGRVNCRVDADYGPIEVGDLLTTSATVGHAMKASDPARSFGAVIGKALRPLKNGRDLIPILVALQ